ncbi:MAG: hypothetical protein ACOX4M_02345 [Acetivibrionales bacterium]|jgi:ribosomal protein L44E
MKYMTGEWYETSQKTGFHLLLRVSKKAEAFSEDYFRKLYKEGEKAWLKLREEVSKVKFDDVFPGEFQAGYIFGSHPLSPSEFEEAYEEAKKRYSEMREQARIGFINRPAFDPEQEKKNYKQSLRYNIKNLKRSLPDEILRKVADIRVLALNRASADVKKEITAYCKANRKASMSTVKAYWKEYRKTFRDGEPSFV